MEITLKKKHRPVFPDRCVRCGRSEPGAHYRIGTFASAWWTLLVPIPGRRVRVDVPACENCRGLMRYQRLMRGIALAACAATGAALGYSLLGTYEEPLKRWLVLGAAVIGAMPIVLWEFFFPRPFRLSADSDSVDYEFRDPEIAAEFAILNEPGLKGEITHVIERVGETLG